MKGLSDFKPLERVTLPAVGDLPCSGLTLVVGPNSSGKSQFLRDIYASLSGEPRPNVVAESVIVRKPPNWGTFFELLESEGYVERFHDDNNNVHIKPKTIYSGTGQAVPNIEWNQAESFYNTYDQKEGIGRRKPHNFLNHFGRMLVTALFLEKRLNGLNSVGLINFDQNPPQHDFHVLHNNDHARNELQKEIFLSFGRSVWTDMSSGNGLCLKVSDGELPHAEDRHSVSKMAKYRTIESEGDGLKSYVTVCIALLLARLPVCLIDEPEMCLHPPQAYNLGRFIGRHASSKDSATFVATHSSQILRGVIQSTRDVEIIRLTRGAGAFSAHRLSATELVEALHKPTLRAESALDGIFSESVVVLEADGDRLVYHTAWETMASELRLDVHFAAVGGTGGIADICGLYQKLKIPVAVIADLDLVTDSEKLSRIVKSLCTDVQGTDYNALLQQALDLGEKIRLLPPTLDEEDFRATLSEISELPSDWSNSDDIAISRRLRALSNRLDRIREIKAGGLKKLPEAVSKPLGALVDSLAAIGLFLVPVGELEEWLATDGVKESKQNKAAWANEAAIKIQSIGSTDRDIWKFLRGVGNFLQRNTINASKESGLA